jgi:hypothetical protein
MEHAVSFEDVLSAGAGKEGTGVMSVYKENLIHICKQISDPKNAERVSKLTIDGKACPALPVGKIVNSLKKLFIGGTMDTWTDQKRYNRSYRYLKNFADGNTLANAGIRLVDVDGGKKHLVIVDRDKLMGTAQVAAKKPEAAAPKSAKDLA